MSDDSKVQGRESPWEEAPIWPVSDWNVTFQTTHWSVVRKAGSQEEEGAQSALETLCRTYWPAVYCFIRKQGVPQEEARDLAQEYFHKLISHNIPGQADSDRGKFRSFLLLTLRHFLADHFRRSRAKKKIPRESCMSMDAAEGDELELSAALAKLPPEHVFDRRWAQALVARARSRVEEEYATPSRRKFFPLIKGYLPGGQPQRSLGEIARGLGVSENLVKVRVHRMRQRFADFLREEIAHTVSSREEAEEELRHLIKVLSHLV